MLLFIFLKNKTSIKREIQQRIPEKLKLRQRRQPFSTVDSCFQTCLSRVNIHHLLMNTIFFPVKFFVLTSHLVFLLKINSPLKNTRGVLELGNDFRLIPFSPGPPAKRFTSI